MEPDVVRVCQPTIDEATRKELMEVFDKGWLGSGPKTTEFEQKFATYVGKKYAIGCNSGTSALDMCLKVYEDEYNLKGGELITSPMTFVSDAIVGLWHGMDVTFADIDPDTLCLDPDSLVITDKTKAIIAIDLHGRLADIKKIREKIGDRKILIVEDAAHAMYTPGVGDYSDIQMYSFQAVKTMPIGDGGMITTDSEEIAKEIKRLSWLNIEKNTYDRTLGRKYTWDYDITKANGIKSYMTDVQAVIGLGQLRRLDEMLAKRRAIEAVYNYAFKDILQIKIPIHSHTVQYYTMQCENRDKLGEYLAEEGISTSVHFKPLSEMTYYKQFVKRPLPNVDKVWTKLLSLPCHDALTWKQVEYVISQVREYYKWKRSEETAY